MRCLALCSWLVFAAALVACSRPAQSPAAWRIGEGRVAPWAPATTRIDPALRGAEVRFEATHVTAPPPIGCDGARYQWQFVGVESLFEGNLPPPAADAARQLGLAGESIPTLRVTCTNAGFDFHRTASGDLLLGLDNVVWTLHAPPAADTPADAVQELLLVHFTHDMGFTPDSIARKQAYLSADLRAGLAAWFSAPRPADEVPAIDGDPFTDSQEYPDRFTLSVARMEGQQARVPVDFADDHASRRVDYRLVREGGRWVVDDLIDARGQSLRGLLAGETAGGPAVADSARDEDFPAFLQRFRAALASGRAGDVAALVQVPFLYEGRQLDTAGFAAIVPQLFPPDVARCMAGAQPVAEEGRQVVFCAPYAFYFGRDAGGYRLIEFAADGESLP